MKSKVNLMAQLDLSVTPNECKVVPIENDPWNDFGYWLEVTGFMAYQAMKYKEWTPDKVLSYSRDYLEKCINDYKIKPHAH